jgi:hypothetical protein
MGRPRWSHHAAAAPDTTVTSEMRRPAVARRITRQQLHSLACDSTARVFSSDSPRTRSRRSIGSGGESSSSWLVWRGMQYGRSQKQIISYLIMLYRVGGLVSMMFPHPMLRFKCRMADYYAVYTTVHYTLYTLFTVIYRVRQHNLLIWRVNKTKSANYAAAPCITNGIHKSLLQYISGYCLAGTVPWEEKQALHGKNCTNWFVIRFNI